MRHGLLAKGPPRPAPPSLQRHPLLPSHLVPHYPRAEIHTSLALATGSGLPAYLSTRLHIYQPTRLLSPPLVPGAARVPLRGR